MSCSKKKERKTSWDYFIKNFKMHEIQFKADGGEEGGNKRDICEVIVLFFRLVLVFRRFLLSVGVVTHFFVANLGSQIYFFSMTRGKDGSEMGLGR